MNFVLHFFSIAFPLEFRYRKQPSRYGWITQVIKTCIKKMILLNVLYKQQTLTEHAKMYIAGYKIINKRVTTEAKREENDKYTLHANNKPRAI
jgi:hypothetical protein